MFSVESWKALFDWGAVVLVGLTFVFGAGALITGNILSGRQSAQLQDVSLKLREQEERAAKAELALLEERQNTANRDLTPESQEALSEKLKPFAGQTAEIEVFPITFEHVYIADTIWGILLNAKWDVSNVKQLSAPSGADVGKPFLVQGIWVQSTPDDSSTKAAKALFEALESTVAPASGLSQFPALPNPERHRVWIYVGDKPTPLRSWVK